MWPVLAVVAVIAVVRAPAPYDDWVLPAALLAVDALLVPALRMTRGQALEALRKSASFHLLMLILGVYVLRGMFHVSAAAEGLPAGLDAAHVPPMVVCFAVPCLVGLITGYTLAGVSTTFPLLAGVFSAMGPTAAAMAYVGSFLGVLASPVHLCLALSRDYFRAGWGPVYRGLTPMLALQTAAAALIAWLAAR
jgi:hypothetical protein